MKIKADLFSMTVTLETSNNLLLFQREQDYFIYILPCRYPNYYVYMVIHPSRKTLIFDQCELEKDGNGLVTNVIHHADSNEFYVSEREIERIIQFYARETPLLRMAE